jgi:hypothetical protein
MDHLKVFVLLFSFQKKEINHFKKFSTNFEKLLKVSKDLLKISFFSVILSLRMFSLEFLQHGFFLKFETLKDFRPYGLLERSWSHLIRKSSGLSVSRGWPGLSSLTPRQKVLHEKRIKFL